MKQRPHAPTGVELTPPAVEGASAGQSLLAIKAAAEPTVLDETDTALIELLLDDGRMTNRELSTASGISEATVGVRLRRLVANRVLIFTTLFDWEAAGFDWFVIAKINVEGRPPREVAEDVARLPECEAAAIVFGDVDIIAYFLVTDRAELHALIGERLAAISGISALKMDLATESKVSALGRRFYLAQQAPPIRLPNPVVSVDDLDAAVMQALLHDGRQSSRSIARQLQVSEGTVRARIQRLVNSGLMRIVAMVEPLALGMVGVIASVGLKVDRDAIATVSAAVEELPQTLFSAVTVGSVDITIAIASLDQNDMLNTVLNHVRSLKGVRTTETLQMIDIVRFAAYMKRLD
jgi:DNA-binding Lrp family transcriptional regulator